MQEFGCATVVCIFCQLLKFVTKFLNGFLLSCNLTMDQKELYLLYHVLDSMFGLEICLRSIQYVKFL